MNELMDREERLALLRRMVDRGLELTEGERNELRVRNALTQQALEQGSFGWDEQNLDIELDWDGSPLHKETTPFPATAAADYRAANIVPEIRTTTYRGTSKEYDAMPKF